MIEKGFLRKVNSVNRSQINPLPLNLEGNNFSRRNRNIINEENGYYILSQKLDTIQKDLKSIGEIIKSSFNRLENLIRELLIAKIPDRDEGKKGNFRVKKKLTNIELTEDKKEKKYAKSNVRLYCEYDKNESNDSKNENSSINQRSVNNLSYTSNKDISFQEDCHSKNSKKDNHQVSSVVNPLSIRRKYMRRN